MKVAGICTLISVAAIIGLLSRSTTSATKSSTTIPSNESATPNSLSCEGAARKQALPPSNTGRLNEIQKSKSQNAPESSEQSSSPYSAKARALGTPDLLESLKYDMSRARTNNAASPMQLHALISELERRYPNHPKVAVLKYAADLDNLFGNDPRTLLDEAQRLYAADPNDSLASQLLVYGLLAQGFQNFQKQLPAYLKSAPDNEDFQYAAVSLDLANGNKKSAADRIAYLHNLRPDSLRYSNTHLKIKEKMSDDVIDVDHVMDFNPQISPGDITRVQESLPPQQTPEL